MVGQPAVPAVGFGQHAAERAAAASCLAVQAGGSAHRLLLGQVQGVCHCVDVELFVDEQAGFDGPNA